VKNERVVGGLSCSQVLDRLSDYLDGELSPEEKQRVEDHLRGCDGCARFGGEFKGTVQALRSHLLRAPPAPVHVQERLRRAIEGEPSMKKP
jgi:anti-sigma factor (TIGR02949 family)